MYAVLASHMHTQLVIVIRTLMHTRLIRHALRVVPQSRLDL